MPRPKKTEQPEKQDTVKMTRRGIVFDAPKEDVPNMLLNGWVKVDDDNR